MILCIQYKLPKYVQILPSIPLLRPNMLQLLIAPQKVIRIRLRNNLPTIRLLNKVFITLLLCKPDGVLLALEVQMCALHEISRGLPSHQRVLPSVAFGENIPVHAPVVPMPVTRLCCCLCWAIDSVLIRFSPIYLNTCSHTGQFELQAQLEHRITQQRATHLLLHCHSRHALEQARMS
jgi:hypothetical protein